MNKKIYFLVLRDILARRYQFGALMVIVGLGIAVYVCLTVAFENIGRSYDRTYRETNFADFIVEIDGAPASTVEEIRSLPNVEAAGGAAGDRHGPRSARRPPRPGAAHRRAG